MGVFTGNLSEMYDNALKALGQMDNALTRLQKSMVAVLVIQWLACVLDIVVLQTYLDALVQAMSVGIGVFAFKPESGIKTVVAWGAFGFVNGVLGLTALLSIGGPQTTPQGYPRVEAQTMHLDDIENVVRVLGPLSFLMAVPVAYVFYLDFAMEHYGPNDVAEDDPLLPLTGLVRGAGGGGGGFAQRFLTGGPGAHSPNGGRFAGAARRLESPAPSEKMKELSVGGAEDWEAPAPPLSSQPACATLGRL